MKVSKNPSRFKFLILAVLLTGLMQACGLKQERLSYDLTENDCGTGNHEFDSLEALCAGLQNSALNNNCAYYLRKNFFRNSGCSGEFTSK